MEIKKNQQMDQEDAYSKTPRTGQWDQMMPQSQSQKRMNLILDIMVVNNCMGKFDEYKNSMAMEKVDLIWWPTWAMNVQVMDEKKKKKKKKESTKKQIKKGKTKKHKTQ